MIREFDLNGFGFLLAGLQWTVLLSIAAFIGGGLLGLPVALARISRIAPLRWMAAGYIALVQGTPLLMQLFLVYYAIAILIGILIDPWPSVLLAFTLHAGAFLGEIWRGAVQAIPHQQWEAAEALALTRSQQLRHVIIPQAFRISIPPTVGFLIQLIKGTSVASIIGFVELTRAGTLIVNVTFQPMLVYPVVAILYFLICWPLSLTALRLERKIDAALGT